MEPEEQGERLQKYIARAGLASRREAERFMREGRVRVNGRVVTELGTKVGPKDRVEVDGERIGEREPVVTVLAFKPASVVTTMKDPEGRRTIRDLIADFPYRLVPVGRLDYATEGLILLTNDGELARRLMHPSWEVPKTYVVKVRGHPDDRALDALREGVRLEDGTTAPALVERLDEDARSTWLEIVLREGKNRQVRRMTEAVGHVALRVVRVAIGALELGGLKPGQYVILDGRELEGLYGITGLEYQSPPEQFEEQLGFILGQSERGKGFFPTRDQTRARRRR